MSAIPRPGTESKQVIIATFREHVGEEGIETAKHMARTIFPDFEEIAVDEIEGHDIILVDIGVDTIFASDLSAFATIGEPAFNIENLVEDLDHLSDKGVEDVFSGMKKEFDKALFDEGLIKVSGSKEGILGAPRPLQDKNQEFHFILNKDMPTTDDVKDGIIEEASRGVGGQLSWKHHLDVDGPTILNEELKDGEVIITVDESIFMREDLTSVTFGASPMFMDEEDKNSEIRKLEDEASMTGVDLFTEGYVKLV